MSESSSPGRPADPSRAEYSTQESPAVELEDIERAAADVEAQPGPAEPAVSPSLGIATVGFIFALTGLLSPVGLALCILALVRARREPDRYGGRSLALTGIIAAVLAIALGAFLFILYWNGYITPASPPKGD